MKGFVIENTRNGSFFTNNPPVSNDWAWVLGVKYATVFDNKEEAEKAMDKIDYEREYAIIKRKED